MKKGYKREVFGLGFKKILLSAVLAVLIAGNVTAFAEETGEKSDYPVIFAGEQAKEKINELSEKIKALAENLTDSQKAEYKEIVSSFKDGITEYIKNMPSDSYEEKTVLLNEKLNELKNKLYEWTAELPEVHGTEETEKIKDAVSGIIEEIGGKIAENSEKQFELHADKTEFVWDRNSELGITVNTNSSSREFSVKKNGKIYSSSLINNGLLIDSGSVCFGKSFLEKLDDGENKIELILKEGNLEITVNVKDSSTEIPVEKGEIKVNESYFEWDKSDLTGIVVNTNSKSKSVLLKKDGELLLSDGERGVYIALGRVGITARILKKLDVGENKLTLAFDDGTAEITVKVTDKKNFSAVNGITADKTEFTWDRNSGESIIIKTNSGSESVSVRQDGKIFSKSDRENVSVSNGDVTMKPEFLGRLSDGENELKLIFDDGNISVKINVTGSAESSENTSESSIKESKDDIGIMPDTGSVGASFVAGAAALSALVTGILLSQKKKKSE